jgi:hypothetical protein
MPERQRPRDEREEELARRLPGTALAQRGGLVVCALALVKLVSDSLSIDAAQDPVVPVVDERNDRRHPRHRVAGAGVPHVPDAGEERTELLVAHAR